VGIGIKEGSRRRELWITFVDSISRKRKKERIKGGVLRCCLLEITGWWDRLAGGGKEENEVA